MRRALIGLVVLLLPAIPAALSVLCDIGEALRVSEKPSEYIGVTYSILAASLFAVVAIVGDPSMLMSGSWRSAWREARYIQQRILRLLYLFLLYLLVLALLIVTEIVEYSSSTKWFWTFDALGFLLVYTFSWSLWLPFEIKSILVRRLESEIDARKNRPKS